jgi:hypothetical protein
VHSRKVPGKASRIIDINTHESDMAHMGQKAKSTEEVVFKISERHP